eukprot:15458799-Alexandrium_andersonii.AAC.1
MDRLSVEEVEIAAEQHHQNGRIERRIDTWKHMAAKCIEERQVIGEAGMAAMSVEVSYAKNSGVRRIGYSPYSWTFGRELDLPPNILGRDDTGCTQNAYAEEYQR